jgi:hypothetical protein
MDNPTEGLALKEEKNTGEKSKKARSNCLKSGREKGHAVEKQDQAHRQQGKEHKPIMQQKQIKELGEKAMPKLAATKESSAEYKSKKGGKNEIAANMDRASWKTGKDWTKAIDAKKKQGHVRCARTERNDSTEGRQSAGVGKEKGA